MGSGGIGRRRCCEQRCLRCLLLGGGCCFMQHLFFRRRIDLLICFMIYYRGYGGYTKPNPIWGSNARKKVSWLEARYTSTIPPWLGGGLGGGLWPPPCVVS